MNNNLINPKNDNIFNLNSKILDVKMRNVNISEGNKTVNYWYLNLIQGIILILVALWVFCAPKLTFETLVLAVSIVLLFTGFLEIISSIQNRNYFNKWEFFFIVGIFDLLLSISLTTFSRPQISSEVLTLLMGYLFLYRSAKLITWSTVLNKYTAINCGWVLLGGIISVMLSFLLLCDQTFLPMTILFFYSFGFLMIGISEINFSLILRKLNQTIFMSSK